MDGILSSVNETFKKRTTSATIGTYLFFWCAYHWQGIYATIFDDQQLIMHKYGLLKSEYVNKYFFGYHGILDWHFIWGLVLPGVLTVVFICFVPRKVFVIFYKQEQGYKVDKRIIKIKEEERIAARQEKLAAQVEKTIDAEIKATDKKQKAASKDPTILWDEEFESIKTKNSFELRDILRCVYEFKGFVRIDSDVLGEDPDFELNPNSLKLADSRELVKIVESGRRIELTKKGKYFASKYEGRL